MSNRKRRTRKDLLQAAAVLMKEGRRPSLEDIAEAALVSRATAYRYFPGLDALLLEASLDVAMPEVGEVFGPDAPTDPLARVEAVDAALHAMIRANEAPMRMMLINALERSLRGEEEEAAPLRQNRRSPLIEAALEPERDTFDPVALEHLERALALVVGPEAMMVFKDVLQLEEAQADAVRHWTIRALVEAARKTP